MARRTVVDPMFGGTLAELRARAGLSLSQAAAVCHVTRGHISNLERGVKSPTEATARALDTGLRAGGRLAALVTEYDLTALRMTVRESATDTNLRGEPPISQFGVRQKHQTEIFAHLLDSAF